MSKIEHPSITELAPILVAAGFEVVWLPVDAQGVCLVDQLPDLLSPETRLVSVMLANNETGVVQPVTTAAEICRHANVPIHTDAVQAVGKIRVSFTDLGVTAMTVSAHKLHGPVGVGAVILAAGTELLPMLHGGAQQLGFRPGTESVPNAIGFQTALEQWHRQSSQRTKHLQRIRDRLERKIKSQCGNIVINGKEAVRLPHTSSIAFPGLDRQMLLLRLDQSGVACSIGSACASGSSEPSPVLLAMGCDDVIVRSSLRLSVGATTTLAEIDQSVDRIAAAVRDLQRQS